MTAVNYGLRIREAMQNKSAVCVGIDPHPQQLQQWGLPDNAHGLREFSFALLSAVADHAAAVKPQSAFFERHGAAGIAVLEEVLNECRSRRVMSILDVKRGDIGSTMTAYAQSYLLPGAPLEADAITVSPFLGVGSLMPAFELAANNQKGVYVLALTSNPEGKTIQHARISSQLGANTVAADLTKSIAALNEEVDGENPGSFGLVVGATVGDAPLRCGMDLEKFSGTFLAPGIGAQGAGGAEIAAVFGQAKKQVLASASRSISASGPDPEKIREALAATAASLP